MATIQTSTPFVNGTAMVAATWNSKYDGLYNELNGGIDNYNVATTAGLLESKIQFADGGHDHSGSNKILINTFVTSGQSKGQMIYFNGSVWSSLGTGSAAQKLSSGIIIDNMEYATNATAQSSYASSNTSYTLAVAYYKLEEASGTRYDATQNANNLTDSGTVAQGTGKIDKCVTLTPTGYLYNYAATNIPTGNSDWSISAWINPNATGTGQIVMTLGYNQNSYASCSVGIVSPGMKVYAPNRVDTTAGSYSFTTGVWYWYYVEYDGASHTLTFYVNNAVDTTSDLIIPSQQTSAVIIGTIVGASNYSFNGSIDEAAVYPRKLTLAERTAIYNGGTGILLSNLAGQQNTQCFSESSIVQQGTYSLKGYASTSSINKTFTRTIAVPINLTNINTITYNLYASRTGSNIKIGIHDSGGTTTETTPNLLNANAWQNFSWDISGVSNANKDAIDSIIITIVNADSENTFYIDGISSPDLRWV